MKQTATGVFLNTKVIKQMPIIVFYTSDCSRVYSGTTRGFWTHYLYNAVQHWFTTICWFLWWCNLTFCCESVLRGIINKSSSKTIQRHVTIHKAAQLWFSTKWWFLWWCKSSFCWESQLRGVVYINILNDIFFIMSKNLWKEYK